jgi:hypothetical protein
MQIKINYTKNHYTLIQLFDNSSVRKWFNYVSTKNYNYKYHLERTPSVNKTVNVAYEWNSIQNTIEYLNKIGLYLNFDLPNAFDYQQSTLNKLHRFFTYNMLWYDVKDDTPNPFSPQFKLDNITKDEWHNIIDVINEAVHTLEKVATLTKNAISISPPINFLSFPPRKDRNTNWLEFDETDIKQNYEYFNNTQYRYLVVLDRSILGKCILQSFVENDDPSAADCTGRMGSHGGFTIVDNPRLQQIYQSPEFKDWANSFNLDINSLPYEFPIGYVVSSTVEVDNIPNYPFTNSIKSIEFFS